MRIVAVEEHCVHVDLLARIDSNTLVQNGWPAQGSQLHELLNPPALAEVGEQRLMEMNAAGISVQVLSVPGPGAELVAGDAGIAIAREYNDRLGQLVSARAGRFSAFAHLPMMTPMAAAEELERAVTECGLMGALINGSVSGKFLDSPEFEPILACAERLDVPLYVHPSMPPQSVRSAYYDGLPGYASMALSISGWGWHAETAVHILRLALSGALDRHPRLRLLIGHMGEGLPAMMERVERVFSGYSKEYLGRNVARAIVDQVWVSTSGFTGLPAFLATLMTFGVDHILFSVDYPFGNNRAAADFLRALPLSPGDLVKVAHANAEGLLGLDPSP